MRGSVPSCFAEVARLLRMSEVRSCDLEMGLSLSDDCVVSEATFVSTPIRPRTSLVLSLKRTRNGSGIDFSTLAL